MGRIVALIQARQGSRRLPGKTLYPIQGKPLLGYMLDRLCQVPSIDQVVVATTDHPRDQAIVEYCRGRNVEVFQGSETDVLDRFYQAAVAYNAQTVVRLTADCPLIDPQIAEQVIIHYLNGNCDYLSNTQDRSFPRGMDIEVFSFAALKVAHNQAEDPSEREHVTLFLYRHPEQFHIGSFEYRLTVDTPEDLELMKKLIPTLKSQSLAEIFAQLEAYPDWVHVNAHIKQEKH